MPKRLGPWCGQKFSKKKCPVTTIKRSNGGIHRTTFFRSSFFFFFFLLHQRDSRRSRGICHTGFQRLRLRKPAWKDPVGWGADVGKWTLQAKKNIEKYHRPNCPPFFCPATTAGAPRIVQGKVRKESSRDKRKWRPAELKGVPKMPGLGQMSPLICSQPTTGHQGGGKPAGQLIPTKGHYNCPERCVSPAGSAPRPYHWWQNGPQVHSTRQVTMLRGKGGIP